MPLVILQLITSRQYRGAEVFAANLSKELLSRGHQVILAGLYEPGDSPLAVDGARHIDLGISRRFFFSLPGWWRLMKLMREIKPDIIQANGSDTLKYAIAARLFTRHPPIIYRNISIISTWMGRDFFKKKVYRWIFNKIDHVSSVGLVSMNDFKSYFGYPDEKISVIRRGISIRRVDAMHARQELVEKLSWSKDIKIAMHVGNFSREKNHIFLLEVFGVIKRVNNKVKLCLVGEGREYARVKKEVGLRNLEDTVYFLGFRSDIGNILPAADVLVMASLVEGVPGVIVEAATYNIPSLAVDVGGVSEVVLDGQTGILVPSHDSRLFAEKLMQLMTDDTRRLQLGHEAYQFAVSNFDPGDNAEKFIKLYNRLLS